MKLLVLSDLHGARTRIEPIINLYQPELLVLPGDIPTSIDLPVLLITLLKRGKRQAYVRNVYQRFNSRLTFKQIRSAKIILSDLLSYDLPIIAIHGNTETARTRQWLSLFAHRHEQLHWISDGFVKIEDTLFVGHGWTRYNPGEQRERTPGDLDEDVARMVMLDTLGRAKQSTELAVLISHSPPYNTPLDFIDHKSIHAGSVPVREMLDSGYFDLSISGHLHESFGTHISSNGWWAVNAGAAIENVACVIDTETKRVDWITNIYPDINLNKIIYKNRVSMNYDSDKG